MRPTVEIRPAARQEFDEASDWYRDRNPEVRDRFVLAVEDVISAVTFRPLSFPVVYGTRARRAVVDGFPYSVFFLLDNDLIIIVSIFHQSRNPIIWRGRVE